MLDNDEKLNSTNLLQEPKEGTQEYKNLHKKETDKFFEEFKGYMDQKFIQDSSIAQGRLHTSLRSICSKWLGNYSVIGDYVGSQSMFDFLSYLNNPLTVSILVDDKNCFARNYSEHCANFEKFDMPDHIPFYWFVCACMCGAENIAKLIFNRLRNSYRFRERIKDFDNLILYTIASDNLELTRFVTEKAIEYGQTKFPELIYYYAFYRTDGTAEAVKKRNQQTVNEIKAMFEKVSLAHAPVADEKSDEKQTSPSPL